MPGFTTNVEFGYHLKSHKIVYGRPDASPNNQYLDHLFVKHYNENPCTTLEQTLEKCVQNFNTILGEQNKKHVIFVQGEQAEDVEEIEIQKYKQPFVYFTADTHFDSSER